jgi:PadR family transcriptional regulator PadR
MEPASRSELLPGTLEMLIMKTLARAPQHGYGIAQYIQQTSEAVLRVEEGSLYPALQRLLLKGWVVAEWKVTPNNRRARYYKLTPEGRKRMADAVESYARTVRAIARVLETA